MAEANRPIRREARASGVAFWKIAKRLGISEPTMTRLMREELPEAKQKQILSIIAELAGEAES